MSRCCDGMFWSLLVQIEQARLQRAEIMYVMSNSEEEDGVDPQLCTGPSTDCPSLRRTLGQGLIFARAANPCLSHSISFQLSSDFPHPGK